MSSTTVHSNKKDDKNKPCVAGSVFQPTEKTLEVPPKGQVYEVISSYIEEQGNIEIPTGNAVVNENGQMQKEDGTVIVTLNPQAIKDLASYRKQRDGKEKKLKAEVKVSSKAGAEIGE